MPKTSSGVWTTSKRQFYEYKKTRFMVQEAMRSRRTLVVFGLLALVLLTVAIVAPRVVEKQRRADCAQKDMLACKALCESGALEACTDLGNLLRAASSTPDVTRSAAVAYQRACPVDKNACVSLASIIATSDVLPLSSADARKVQERACEGGRVASCLASLSEFEKNSFKNIDETPVFPGKADQDKLCAKVRDLLAVSCEQGVPEDCLKLRDLLVEGAVDKPKCIKMGPTPAPVTGGPSEVAKCLQYAPPPCLTTSKDARSRITPLQSACDASNYYACMLSADFLSGAGEDASDLYERVCLSNSNPRATVACRKLAEWGWTHGRLERAISMYSTPCANCTEACNVLSGQLCSKVCNEAKRHTFKPYGAAGPAVQQESYRKDCERCRSETNQNISDRLCPTFRDRRMLDAVEGKSNSESIRAQLESLANERPFIWESEDSRTLKERITGPACVSFAQTVNSRDEPILPSDNTIPENFHATMQHAYEQIRQCYGEYLESEKEEGDVRFSFEVNPSGTTSAIQASPVTSMAPKVVSCITTELKAMRFEPHATQATPPLQTQPTERPLLRRGRFAGAVSFRHLAAAPPKAQQLRS